MGVALALVSVLVVVGVVWFVGRVLELEYPHYFELRKVRRAVTADGRPALSVIAAALGTTEDCLHVHTCTFCRHWYWEHARGVVHVQVASNVARSSFDFAYHRASNQIVPGSDTAAARFTTMWPDETAPMPLPGQVGSDRLVLPQHWLVRSVGA